MATEPRDGRRKGMIIAGIVLAIGVCVAVYGMVTVASYQTDGHFARNTGVLLIVLGIVMLVRAVSKKSS